jgi:hypothetical protein
MVRIYKTCTDVESTSLLFMNYVIQLIRPSICSKQEKLIHTIEAMIEKVCFQSVFKFVLYRYLFNIL